MKHLMMLRSEFREARHLPSLRGRSLAIALCVRHTYSTMGLVSGKLVQMMRRFGTKNIR